MLSQTEVDTSLIPPHGRNELVGIATQVGIGAATSERVVAVDARCARDPALAAFTHQVSDLLSAGASPDALDRLRHRDLEAVLGDDAYAYYLMLALRQVRPAEERHRRLGVDSAVTRATLVDLGLWSRLFEDFGLPGLSLEILGWVQHYLHGNLFRVGTHQFELVPFGGEVVALRRHGGNELRCISSRGWDREAPTWVTHRIDDQTGVVSAVEERLDAADWELVLDPGAPMLEMHTPADARLSERNALRSIAQGFEFFRRLAPEASPRGVWGKGWFLDPQVQQFLPRNRGIRWFQTTCHLFPYDIPEECTVRRFFGPRATRASCVVLPRDRLNTLQRAIADHLSDPAHGLVARGGFFLLQELEALWRA